MRGTKVVALSLALAAAPLWARAVKMVEPLAAGLVGHATVVATSVTVNEASRPSLAKLEEKAAAKRTAAKLQPVDAAAARPPQDEYATLPLTTMMPLEIEDVTKQWGLVSGRRVKLAVTIDTLKTANAGMAMLVASSDQLAGMVDVLDADTGAKLGSFYVDVINSRSGLMGLAMRGGGVREKLAAEFAKHVAKQLSGGKPLKPGAAPSAT